MTIQKLVLEDQVRYAEGVVADYLISQGWTEEDPAQEPLPVGDPVEVLTPPEAGADQLEGTNPIKKGH